MRKKIIEVEKLKVRKLLGQRSVLNSDDEYCSGSSTAEDFDAGLALRYRGDLDVKCGLWHCRCWKFSTLLLEIVTVIIPRYY